MEVVYDAVAQADRPEKPESTLLAKVCTSVLVFLMIPPSANELLLGLQSTLRNREFDYEQTIRDLGQVAASEARSKGAVFGFREHIRALLLSQLSNQRPWKPIAQNLESIRIVFCDYDPEALQHADPIGLAESICKIRCGNRAILKQMNGLAANIKTLRSIERDFGSLDKFVTSQEPHIVASLISRTGRYKLKCIGPALAMEYLRNVGGPLWPEGDTRRGHRQNSEFHQWNREAAIVAAAANETFCEVAELGIELPDTLPEEFEPVE
jgi:hypothetical protein